jgi:hypothetical protein
MLRVRLRSTVLRLVFVTAVFSLASGAGKPAAAQPAAAGPDALLRKLADQYVPTDAQAAAFASTQTLLTREGSEMMPREVITAAGMKGLGFDPLTIDVVIGCTIILPDSPPLAGAVIHTSAPLPAAGLLPELKTEPAELAGKTYSRALQPIEPSHCRVDDHTLIVAMEPMLQLMLAEKKASPLRTLLAKATLKNDVTAVAALETLRPMIDMARQQMGEVPPPFAPLLKIPDHIEMAQLTVNVRDGLSTKLTLVSQDEAGAKELTKLLNTARAFGKQAALMQIAAQPKSEDPIEQAMQQYMRRLTEFQIDQLTPKQEGKRVEFGYQANSGVATTGVMVALLLPALQVAREAARKAQSINNLRQIGIGLHNHLSAHRTFPAFANFDGEGKPLLSWRVHILPYIEQQTLYEQFHLDEPWDSEHNRKLIEHMPGAYASPNQSRTVPGTTVYLALAAEDSLLGAKPLHPRDIKDGLSNTIAVVEANDENAVIWTKPEDLPFDATSPMAGLGAMRKETTLLLLGDGSCFGMLNAVLAKRIAAMVTTNGSETVPPLNFPQ